MLPLEVNVLCNINHPDGTTYSQAVYTLKYSPFAHDYFKKNKGVTFISWVRRLIPESFYEENVNKHSNIH